MSGDKTAAEALRAWLMSDVGLSGGLSAIGVDPLGSAGQVQRLRDRVAELESEHRRGWTAHHTAVLEREAVRVERDRLIERVDVAESRVAELEQVTHDYNKIVEERSAAYAECLALRERADKALVRAEAAEKREERTLRKGLTTAAELRARAEAAERDLADKTADRLVENEILRRERDAWRAKYEALLARATVPQCAQDLLTALRTVRVIGISPGDQSGAEAWLARLIYATQPEPPKRKTRLDAACEYANQCSDGCIQRVFDMRRALEAAGVDPDEELPEGVA